MRPLVIGCGAFARELVALTRRAGFPEVDLTCLPASLHNRPERIPAAVRARIRRARAAGREQLFVAYADCGTGGLLDRVLEEEGVARLEGAHCYEVYAGRAAFAALGEEEPGTFYVTDFLARNFDRLVIRGLGLDRHPELLPLYFANYTRVVYLAQTEDPALTAAARRGAGRLGLRFERRFTGHGQLAPAIAALGPTIAAVRPTIARTPDRPRLASDANNPSPVVPPTAESVRSLRPAQGVGRSTIEDVESVRLAQRNRRSAARETSWLRSTQRDDGSLRVVQRTVESAAGAALEVAAWAASPPGPIR